MSTKKLCLSIQSVSHNFGDNKILHDINVDIYAGQFVAFVGPSGCGKSTLFRSIVGTHPTNKGTIGTYDRFGNFVPCLTPTRDIGIVYQQYSLYDFLTAQKNVAVGRDWDQYTVPKRLLHPIQYLKFRRRAMVEAAGLLKQVGLGEHIKKYPAQLSGGQRQRVAVAQALFMKPRVLLLDEPFGALDESMREELQKMLLRLYQQNLQAIQRGLEPPYTVIIVTHELTEAIYVGDRVIGLSQHWDWQTNHRTCPGATIVYDQPSPVFHPDERVDWSTFNDQRDDIRRAISPKVQVCK